MEILESVIMICTGWLVKKLMLINPIPVLYQSGYLTIKRYDEKLGIYRLGFPNREVEEGFVCFLLPYYASVDKVESLFEIQKFVREVRAGD